MKKLVIGLFNSREEAEKVINELHRDLNIPTEDISFAYRNEDGETQEVSAEDIASGTPAEGAKTGAKVGGTIGALAGLATVAGMIPVIGPIFAAGPLVTALGIGAGAVGTAAAGALTGAIAGGLIGALVKWGVSEPEAQHYSDRVSEGDVLVSIHTEHDQDTSATLIKNGATDVNVYTPSV